MTLFIRASILNGVAKERISMAVAIADPTASALLNDGLIPICGLAGAAVTSTSASLAVVLAVAYFVHELKRLVNPLSTAKIIFLLAVIYVFLKSTSLTIFIGYPLEGIIYILMLFATKEITREELQRHI